MRRPFLAVLAGTSLVAIATATPAVAQATQQNQAQPAESAGAPADAGDEAIIITGTQIRGIKPVGSNVVSVSKEEIRATGVVDTNQVLGQLPQSNFFLELPQPGGGVIQAGTPRVPINRPNLRNIPGTTTGSGSPTLVLIDGHRVVPAGIEQAAVDAGVVPPGILERNEVILDGASAVYGSDAVAGVINFITRKRFNGTEVSARYGIADNYWQADASITQGFTWGSGGVTFNYDFGKNSNILNRHRDFAEPLNWVLVEPPSPAPNGVLLPPQVDDLTCDLANVRNRTGTPAGAAGIYHVSGSTIVPGPAYCWGNANATYTPAQERHSAFITFSQDITDTIRFEATGFYSNRKQTANQGPFTSTVTIAPTNPFYRCNLALTGTCAVGNQNANQQVSFSYGPALGYDGDNSGLSETTTKLWQITPEIIAELGGGWQVRALVGHGRSDTSVFQRRIVTTVQNTLIAGTTTTTALNPYDITATNPALFANLVADHFTQAKQRFTQARIVADGPLFTLPGGEVRVAVGAEWMKQFFERRNTNDTTFVLGDFVGASTKSKSAFAEIVVPVVGEDNSMPGIHSLVLSASGRYDDYGEFGDTFNPKFAITYQPFDWLTFRGNWGKSFRAPNAVDKLASTNTQIRCIQGAGAGCISAIQNPTNIDPNYNFTATGNNFTMLYLTGTIPELVPETSTGWSVGVDVAPPMFPGLTFSATYWKINFENFISTPNTTADIRPAFLVPDTPTAICYPPYTAPATSNNPANPGQTYLCTAQQIADFAALAPNSGPAALAAVQSAGLNIAILLDGRVRNLGGAKVSGVDLTSRFRHEVPFGSVDANVNITLPIKNDFQLIPGGAIIDELAFGDSTFLMNASVGADIGNFRAQATLRHRSGYLPDSGTTRLASQKRIPAFTVIDLAFRYDFEGSDWLTEDLSLSFNINNVFNQHPPFNKTTGGGVTNGSTLGRLFQLGVNKRF